LPVLPRRLLDGVVSQLDDGHWRAARGHDVVMGIVLMPGPQSTMATATVPRKTLS
jgi:hypothetical protein